MLILNNVTKSYADKKVKKVAKQAQAKKSRLEKLQSETISFPYEAKEIFYRIESEQLHNKILIKFENVCKSFKNNLLFQNANFSIENGEKTALIGKNGAGKTTLIKMILDEQDYIGNIWKSKNIKIAYLPQNSFNLESDKTIFEFANEFSECKTQFFTNLCNMGINKVMFDKKISTLSSGEKMKLKLNELICGEFNFLILDEPTNNLDIPNKLFLESVLKNYKGNLLIVSHDKTLIKNICNSKIIIKNKKISKE